MMWSRRRTPDAKRKGSGHRANKRMRQAADPQRGAGPERIWTIGGSVETQVEGDSDMVAMVETRDGAQVFLGEIDPAALPLTVMLFDAKQTGEQAGLRGKVKLVPVAVR